MYHEFELFILQYQHAFHALELLVVRKEEEWRGFPSARGLQGGHRQRRALALVSIVNTLNTSVGNLLQLRP